jgi:predicted enzyme related to lactoylglutathione lyase
VFGWEFEAMEGFDNYWLYTAGPGDLGGGFVLRGETAPNQVRNYMRVDSVDASLEAVTANGGSLVTPKTDIGIGWYAAVKDTEGNEIALWQRKPEG